MNIAEFLVNAAARYGNRPGVTRRGQTRTYSEVNARSACLGSRLRSCGVDPGDRVVIFMDNAPELIESLFAVLRIGAAVVPCNARSTEDELRYLVADSEASAVITDESHRIAAKRGASGCAVLAAEETPSPLFTDLEHGDLRVTEDMHPTDLAWLFYTSGTTGKPKGAMLSHGNLNFVTVSWLADLTPMDEHDVTLHMAPLTHGAGFHALASTARASHQVLTGGTSFDPAEVLDLMRQTGVTNTWMVPTQLIRLTDATSTRAQVPPSLKYVVYGGAPIVPTALERAVEVFGHTLVQLYAQGETPMTATILRPEDHRGALLASAGWPRIGVEMRIANEQGAEVPKGEVGEVLLRGPAVMSGYWRRPDATGETMRDGWLHTGDLGRIGDQGALFLLDRTKDMIISGGSNVYAVEVEAVLAQCGGVHDVAVVGVSDDLWGERVEAVVVPESKEVQEADLERYCRDHLAGYKIPRRYHFVEQLPRNAYGKVLKSQLRRELQEVDVVPLS